MANTRSNMRRLVMPAGPMANAGEAPAKPDHAAVTAAVDKLQDTFARFVEANDQRLAEIEKGRGDVVSEEKVDRINAELGNLQQTVDGLGDLLQANAVRGTNDNVPAAVKTNERAFEAYVRKGGDDAYAATIKPDSVRAAATTQSDPDGGFLVPDGQESAITTVLGLTSIMRSISTVISTSQAVYTVNKDTRGASSGWVGEQGARTETDTPSLSQIRIPTHEIYANPAATQGLLDDAATDIGAWFASSVATEFDEKEGAAFVSGNGVEKPKGFLDYTTVADASWAWGKLGFKTSGVAAALSDSSNNGIDALIDLVYALKSQFRASSTFVMNDLTAATVRKLKDDQGNYHWQPSSQAGEPATLLGYAALTDEHMPNIAANAFPIAFGDFRRGYMIVDRIGIRVLRDPYTNKPYVHFYTTKRVGGGIQDFQAIKLLKISA
jgi:HK97 family phage major capsid protein